MRVLVLDISSSTGWTVFEGEMGTKPNLLEYGTIVNPKTKREFGPYPWSFIKASQFMVTEMMLLIVEHGPDVIVIEETNKGQNRYSQKYLEFIHCLLLDELNTTGWSATPGAVVYVSTGDWRKNQSCNLSKEDKSQNAKLGRAKKKGQSNKEAGIRGKITRKHVAIRHANAQYGLNLIVKDDDIADAICIGLAFFNNVSLANGE